MSELTENERFEKLAEEFNQLTGLLAPGKDAPAIEAGPEMDPEVRRAAWKVFISLRTKLTEAERKLTVAEAGEAALRGVLRYSHDLIKFWWRKANAQAPNELKEKEWIAYENCADMKPINEAKGDSSPGVPIVEALEFYAGEDSYKKKFDKGSELNRPSYTDWGAKARRALGRE